MAKRPYTGTVERWFIFCQVAQVAGGNALADVWDFDDGGAETFNQGAQLSATGLDPATHIGVGTVADTDMNTGIESAIVTGTPWLTGYKETDGWTWETALVDAGLQVIPPVEP